MFKKLLFGVLLGTIMVGPIVIAVGIGALLNPPTLTGCRSSAPPGIAVGDVPNELTVTTASGGAIVLNQRQIAHAVTIIRIGSQTAGVTRDAVQIALMAAPTESNLKQLANTAAYPESGAYAHDGNAHDHDSLGLFQMRPQTGWGTVAQLMDPTYQARAFYGGPEGPNQGSPRGLLDIPDWANLSKGEAAQAVEVSAYPDRYGNFEPAAQTLLDTLSPAQLHTKRPALSRSRVVFPLPEGSWLVTDTFGPRTNPVTGAKSFHTGLDLGAEEGTPILAAADGVVTAVERSRIYGGLVIIEHQINGRPVATAYAHMWKDGIHVHVGDRVIGGQHVGDVGSAGQSTGPHLHFEVRPGGARGRPIDPVTWLGDQESAHLQGPIVGALADCQAKSGAAPEPVSGDPNRLVDDPTSSGLITARTLHLYEQARKLFPDTSWACYSPRPGSKSEHPLGRACDITFGNQIGTRPAPGQLDAGWQLTTWLKENAQHLGVAYLIWQGKIWSQARNAEGWRDYNGGGMHDPHDITGGHYDHLHVTVNP
ncbi:M23 family metallopeptidase [Microlunatus sp. GCM10028923]|uniref:M23 family metallopeptidase n=1 Tax=Microlunatus sp. GCM10028923 TaxID=3273400 RepID=UPI00360DF850